ncbi:hypothetical protein [Salinispira pacifica]|uniref:Zinc ribbon domain-containing protein n=1 Tax=Salinispira pacifica TaxID=1307761 RepID=V5WKN5_9SPIO|nr:hypothetical protein [Salinispira pacifica]AHC16313.1 hypothetical protein L21SP2_2967 [Salinispira pacifica]
MKYCPECGVGVQNDMHEYCPLCSAQLQHSSPETAPDSLSQPQTRLEGFTGDLRRRPWLLAAVSAAVLLVPAAISLIVDLFVNKTLTWSPTVLSSLMLLWFYIGLPPLVFYRSERNLREEERRRSRKGRFWILMLLNTLVTFGFLVLVDALHGSPGLQWAVDFGGLICLSTFVIIMLFFYTLQPPGAAGKGWILFILLSLYIGSIDLLVSVLLGVQINRGWSLIVAASLIPIGIIYFVIVYVVGHSERARRRLHL